MSSPAAARNFIDLIRQKCDFHATQPLMAEAFPELGERVRIFSVRNYVVIHVARADGIHVLRVVDGHRDYPTLFGSAGDEEAD